MIEGTIEQLAECTYSDAFQELTDKGVLENKRVINYFNYTPGADFKRSKLVFINTVFTREVVFILEAKLKKVEFRNCVFEKKFQIMKSKLEELTYQYTTFNSDYIIKDINIDTYMFYGCAFNGYESVILNELNCVRLSFRRNNMANAITIKPQSIKRVDFEGGSEKYNIVFSQNDNQNVLDAITLTGRSFYNTEYSIRNVSVAQLHIYGDFSNSNIQLNRIKVQGGVLDFFINPDSFKVNGILPLNDNSYLIVKNSTLGKAEINDCDFSLFKKIKIIDSSIIEIVTTNNKWCNADRIEARDPIMLQENFRQLKVVMMKNADKPNELFFKRQEMHAFLKNIKNKPANFKDKFILFTTWLSNDYGLNWYRPLLWLLMVNIPFYVLSKYSLGQTHFNSVLIWDEIGRFFLYINPLHSLDKVFRLNDLNRNLGLSILFDGIGRIINSFLLYQFVQAFRKFAR